jgi:hypothetical protein
MVELFVAPVELPDEPTDDEAGLDEPTPVEVFE